MSSGQYELWLTNDIGEKIASLGDVISLTASRSKNLIGSIDLQVRRSFNESLLSRDRLIQLWRTPLGSTPRLFNVYFVRYWSFSRSGTSENVLIRGPDAIDLMRRRIVAHYSGSSQASRSDFADDMAKDVVRNSIADGTNPVPEFGTRIWSNLSVATDVSQAALIDKAFAWKTLLTLGGRGALVDIAQSAREQGDDLWFDIVPTTLSTGSFEFRTWIGQPGPDVSDSVIFSVERSNLMNPFWEIDYRKELTYIYAGGKGEGTARLIEQVRDATREGGSIWARSEGFTDARSQDTAAEVDDRARNALESAIPTERIGGAPINVPTTQFGTHWDWGYKVGANYRNKSYSPKITTVVLNLNAGRETIQAVFDYS